MKARYRLVFVTTILTGLILLLASTLPLRASEVVELSATTPPQSLPQGHRPVGTNAPTLGGKLSPPPFTAVTLKEYMESGWQSSSVKVVPSTVAPLSNPPELILVYTR